MSKWRGNLTEGGDTPGSGEKRPPSGAKAVKGGEVSMRDDIIRTPADKTRTPPSSKGSKWASLPGKPITGAKGARGRKTKFTAQDAAAALGKRC